MPSRVTVTPGQGLAVLAHHRAIEVAGLELRGGRAAGQQQDGNHCEQPTQARESPHVCFAPFRRRQLLPRPIRYLSRGSALSTPLVTLRR